MDAGQIGEFIGSFATALSFAVVWLLITYFIPPLRRRFVVSYGIVMSFWAVALTAAAHIG